jgi:hypothetical protein
METLAYLSLTFYITGVVLAWRESCSWEINLSVYEFEDRDKEFPYIDGFSRFLFIVSILCSWISFIVTFPENRKKYIFKARWLPRLNKREKAIFELWCSENDEDNQFAAVLAEKTGNKNLAEYITTLLEKERRWK